MTRVLYVDCVGGVAGDMLLAALLDAGADAATSRGLGGEGLAARPRRRAERHGIARARVTRARRAPSSRTAHWASIRAQIDAAGLPDAPRARAQDAFRASRIAEGRIHGIDPELVHFHEVGAVDAIAEVVGVALALESARRSTASSARRCPWAAGFVDAAHGRLPLPAPATLELLSGAPLTASSSSWSWSRRPARRSSPRSPTASGRSRAMTLAGSGYGAGTRDLEALPNVVRVMLGTDVATAAAASRWSRPTSTTCSPSSCPTPPRPASPPARSTSGRRRRR